MLRFNASPSQIDSFKPVEFQYILCYGSTLDSTLEKIFNNSFQYILCYGSTENRISGIPLPAEFQYILCYGSTGYGFLG